MSLAVPRSPQPAKVDHDHDGQLPSMKHHVACSHFRTSLPIKDFEEVVSSIDREHIDYWSLWLDLKLPYRSLIKALQANGL
jgi:hypothetical protein